ncbi:HVSL domain-containing protein [Aspergillus melleus]|uniref:HVSL domain-containing protein n=1 Tax=Aspergillus melleus TaxID=138277 RepID=UPI001E8D8C74|nr:poly(U)-specific 3'-to-5' RNA exonuclease [Aspergillus melleus]KAH8429968.1 poly(U)-specific 3'-to-5' RNA exonuclease [Aspergillus melleus]
MALVQYSDSESEEESPPRPIKKICPAPTPASSLPPLPKTFHDLYASSTRVSVKDDPSLHGGRKRVIPHIEGNWPTHLYLEWFPSKDELAVLSDILRQCEDRLGKSNIDLHSLLHSDLGAQLPLHISLSRPVVLRTEQKQPFLETFTTALQDSHISAFDVVADSLHCVSNYEQTRWFYVLRVRKPEHNGLNRLLGISNRCLARYGQPPLYEPPSGPGTDRESRGPRKSTHKGAAQSQMGDYSECFHISLAWSLTGPSSEDHDRIAQIDLRRMAGLRIPFDCVKAKLGNQITSIPLSTGIFGQRG